MYVLFIRLILFFSSIYNNKLNKTKFEQFLFYFILFLQFKIHKIKQWLQCLLCGYTPIYA
jgi:hypothetical protein